MTIPKRKNKVEIVRRQQEKWDKIEICVGILTSWEFMRESNLISPMSNAQKKKYTKFL